jgi:hypothetical protein
LDAVSVEDQEVAESEKRESKEQCSSVRFMDSIAPKKSDMKAAKCLFWGERPKNHQGAKPSFHIV